MTLVTMPESRQKKNQRKKDACWEQRIARTPLKKNTHPGRREKTRKLPKKRAQKTK